MARKLLLSLIYTLGIGILSAQTVKNIKVEGPLPQRGEKSACLSDAGTISFGVHTGQSNNVTPDTIYLCFNDQIEILHDMGTANLSGDPNLLTPAGIVYAYYDCPPTLGFNGPTLGDIQADICLNRTSPIVLNGMNVTQDEGIWVEAGDIEGNITFVNDGSRQTAFKNGEWAQFFFAPLTIDNFDNLTYELDTAGVAGGCVNLRNDEAFSIVFLNEIQSKNISIGNVNNGCGGVFQLEGGLPEYDSKTWYDVSIVLQTDPSVQGELLATLKPRDNEDIEFFVPQPGIYDVIVEDGVSCGTTFTIDMTTCQSVDFEIEKTTALPGDTTCLSVSIGDGFTDILSFQATIAWDTTVLSYVDVTNFNNGLLGFTDASAFGLSRIDEGLVTFNWFDAAFSGVNLPPGSVLFDICFSVDGDIGEDSPINFISRPLPIEILNANNNEKLGFTLNNGAISVSEDSLFASYEIEEVQCFNDNDGGFTVTIAGGIAPYQVQWTQINTMNPLTDSQTINQDGQSATFSPLQGGDYEIIITDAALPDPSVRIDTITIFSPLSLGVNVRSILPNCTGESTGMVEAELIVGTSILNNPDTSEYTFTWNVTNENTPVLDSVPAGFYAVTVVDSRGCEAFASGTMADPPLLELNATIDDATCSGVEDGSLDLAPVGGTAPFTFNWQAGLEVFNGTGINSQPTNLAAGIYAVTVIDDNGCEGLNSFEIRNEKTLSLNPIVNDAACFNENSGSIFVTGTSNQPIPPFSFDWDGPFTDPPSQITFDDLTSELSNLAPGDYFVTLTDAGAAACAFIDTFTVGQPDSIELTVESTTLESCTPGNDGEVIIGAIGGTYPYAYEWIYLSNDTLTADSLIAAETDSIGNNLIAGTYKIIMTDANGCIDSIEAQVGLLDPPLITSLDNFNLVCADDQNGVLMVEAQPQAAPITGFQWSNGQTGTQITNLAAGQYNVTVSASDGCIAVGTGFVIAPDPLLIDSINSQTPSCPGDSDGSLTVFASGGSTPYTYIWDNQPQNDTTTFNLYPGLAAGTYSVTVVDANNCEAVSSSAIVEDPPAIQLAYMDTVDVSCFEGTCDGALTAIASYTDPNVTGIFSFSWETGETDLDATSSRAVQLCAGFQSITVTDAVGCFLIDSVQVPSPPSIDVTPDVSPITCNGFDDGAVTVNVSGGAGGFTFNWVETGDMTNALTDLVAGTYNLIITDANGCSKTQRVEIDEPTALDLILDLTQTRDLTCGDTNDGVIAVTLADTTGINALRPSPYTRSNAIRPG
ncbi:MAG: hypothetical protein AAFO07_23610, partial [Bacteroidota bacterium]